ncbi:MAG: hypothetical protein AB7U61_09595 [Methylocystis sp.]
MVVVTLMPTSSMAGVTGIAGKAATSLSSPLDRVDWRSHPHHHHSWRAGWHYRCPRFSCGTYAGANPANAPGVYAYAAPHHVPTSRWMSSYLRALDLYKDDVNAREAADGMLSD